MYLHSADGKEINENNRLPVEGDMTLKGSRVVEDIAKNEVILAGAAKAYKHTLDALFGFIPTKWGVCITMDGGINELGVYSSLNATGGYAAESDNVIFIISNNPGYPVIKEIKVITPGVILVVTNNGATDCTVSDFKLWALKGV